MRVILYLFTLVHVANLLLLDHLSKTFGNNNAADEPCNRNCIKNQSRTCKFFFEVEDYYSMNKECGDCPRNITSCYNQFCIPADGLPRAVTVINKQLPGPPIIVCRGDNIVVDVKNSMPSDTTSIHWHGILQRGSQYNDGVPFVTQCPITPGATFRYQFKAEIAGTFFYHSHSGIQRGDGVTGALVVREPDENRNTLLKYDYDLDEHIIHFMDWDHELALTKYEGYTHWINGTNEAESMLVNGLGRNATFVGPNNQNIFTPTARFIVKPGYRYRFRLINSGNLDCPIQVSIDNHTMEAISSDGTDYQPVQVNSIMILTGERYDFILNANQPIGVYWIKFKGYISCEVNGVHQVAVLQYQGAPNDAYPPGHPTYEEAERQELELNPWNSYSDDATKVQLTNLRNLDLDYKIFTTTPQYMFPIPFDLNLISHLLIPQINHVTNAFMPSPLLTNGLSVDDSLFCDDRVIADSCRNRHCKCSFGRRVSLNSIVELILVNEAQLYKVNHPFHLHGHKFRVVAIEKLGDSTTIEKVLNLHRAKKITRNLERAPLKDTIGVPPGGYAVIRFVANNPGYWIFHCHIDHHAGKGMFMVFQVGSSYEMPSTPNNFPTCGDYLPSIMNRDVKFTNITL